MKKLKIVVYAISKNESKFVDRWVDSMQEADQIIVLDTGSKDNTVEKLQKRNVSVYQRKINPWRFDVARNVSLDLVPMDTDICVCTDLDEIFEKGWRKQLEKDWQKKKPTRMKYLYHWKLKSDDTPVLSFYADKIHTRKNYRWKYPVHEILITNQKEKVATTKIVLKHYPDKSKSRGSYLPLLELSVKEDPNNDRNLHYLGREYMFYQKWDQCIETLHQHLNCQNATWKDERAASMRFLARAYYQKGYLEEAELWFRNATKEAPYLREAYVELGQFYFSENEYEKAYPVLKQALQITTDPKTYIHEEFAWNDEFYDLLSLTSFYTKHYQEAVEYVQKAIEKNPHNSRYQTNLELMKPYRKEV